MLILSKSGLRPAQKASGMGWLTQHASAHRPQTPNPRPHFSRQPERIRTITHCYGLIPATKKRGLDFHSRTRLKRRAACICQPPCFSNQPPDRIRTIPDYSGLRRATKKKRAIWHGHASRMPTKVCERIKKSPKDHCPGGSVRHGVRTWLTL